MSVMSFDLSGRVAVVAGGYGVLGGSIAAGLAGAGVHVVILGRSIELAQRKVIEIGIVNRDLKHIGVAADVLDVSSLTRARNHIIGAFGGIDILINAAGGNIAKARTNATSPFSMDLGGFDEVVRLNLHGSVTPALIFGEAMADRGRGSIINISSMAALRPLSGIAGYSAAKAAVENFTRWLAVELARLGAGGVRVNAVAPGFFLASQNRSLLVNTDGSPTVRAATILSRTPMGRFGEARELDGIVQFLASDSASFVTGVVIPVDGGFSADAGI